MGEYQVIFRVESVLFMKKFDFCRGIFFILSDDKNKHMCINKRKTINVHPLAGLGCHLSCHSLLTEENVSFTGVAGLLTPTSDLREEK